MSKTIALLAIILLLAACDTDKRENDFTYYFNLKSFISDEVKRLKKENPTVKKLTYLSGKTEEKKLAISNWEKELSEFLEANINKKANIDMYKVDSSFNSKYALTEIKYTALETKLKTKELTIFFKNNHVTGFDASLSTENTLYNSNQQLHYDVDEGYTIYGGQDVKLYGRDTFAIEVSYLP